MASLTEDLVRLLILRGKILMSSFYQLDLGLEKKKKRKKKNIDIDKLLPPTTDVPATDVSYILKAWIRLHAQYMYINSAEYPYLKVCMDISVCFH